MDFVADWQERTEIQLGFFIKEFGIGSSKFYQRRDRCGKANEYNGKVPRDFWLERWEKEAIVRFYREHPDEGYRMLAFMMLDRDVVYASPTSVWRVLNEAGLLRRWNNASRKGTGFVQPLKAHEHWHVDVSYLNICGTFYYLCSVLDGMSRYLVHWDIREHMTKADVGIILQHARERFPDARSRVVSDNSSQFIAKGFKEFIRLSGMTHVKTSPFYPQSNGKVDRWHGTVKRECIRPRTPLSLEDARRIVSEYVEYYNNVRLHSAIGYVAPKDKLEGKEEVIFAERDRKLETARGQRKARRLAARMNEGGCIAQTTMLN